ncbi:hypothetical protein AVEN_202272-1 [Araneus ventricosus]|uniref:Uncharacterized protein n=1 Tax=Araneus ventricosus TaxID=182803 RepID=A0A4Y2CPG7_ARAVE|nr:hypothetical protein AVEN_202272-1 [Araneus ventricosus]
MKQLCSRGNVEDTALMQYFIKGIPDSVIRKHILYGCQNLSEFKKKLRVYDKTRPDYDKAKRNKPKFGNETKDRIKAPKIEYKDKFKDTKLIKHSMLQLRCSTDMNQAYVRIKLRESNVSSVIDSGIILLRIAG